MKKMTIIIIVVLALVVVAGGFWGYKYLQNQILDGPGMVNEVDSLEADSVSLADDGKHTADYIRQRVDAMYACYKNPKYDEGGVRLMQRGNLDSAYCSLRYQALYKEALEAAGDDDIVLDYDHWTNSQDDNNFTYEVGRIDQITDSTAFAEVYGKNYGNDYTIVLGLYFERGDWYVDDFLSPDRKDGEKDYFHTYIITKQKERQQKQHQEPDLNQYAE